MKAIWYNTVIAESDDTFMMRGQHYFLEACVRKNFISKSTDIGYCPWRGYAESYDIIINGEKKIDGVRVYPNPYPSAAKIKDLFIFSKDIEVIP